MFSPGWLPVTLGTYSVSPSLLHLSVLQLWDPPLPLGPSLSRHMSTAVAQLVPLAALCELALFLKFTLAQDSLQRKQLYPPHYSRTDLVITLLHVLVLFHPGFSDVSCSFRPLLLRSYLVWNMKTSFSRALSTLGMVPGLLRGLRRAYSSEAAQASLASPCLFLKYLAVTSSGRCGSCLVPIVPCTFTWLLKCFLHLILAKRSRSDCLSAF